MNEYSLFGKLTALEGQGESLVTILLEAAESLENYEPCLAYLVHVSPDEADAVYVYERWTSEEAHQQSLTLESTQRLIQQARPILIGMERLHTLEFLGGKGAR